MSKCQIISYNVRGLRDKVKRWQVFHYLHIKNFDIMLTQETHSLPKDERLWSNQWGNKIWFSHGENNARGVGILFNKKLQCDVHNVITDTAGRYIILYCSLFNMKWVIANCYAPNSDSPQFFMEIFRHVNKFNPDYKIIGGDFNLALDINIDRNGKGVNNEKVAKVVNTALDNDGLLDV